MSLLGYVTIRVCALGYVHVTIRVYCIPTDLSKDSSRTLCLQLLVLLLPPAHHNVLYQLLQFLSVIAHTIDNKMDAHNLSVVFAPTLFFDIKCVSNSTFNNY